MAHVLLSESDWDVENDDQDIRGLELLDSAGQSLGIIQDMVINTETEMVDDVVMEDGTRYSAEDIDIGEGVVYLRGASVSYDTGSVRSYGDRRNVRRNAGVTGSDSDVHTPPQTMSGTDAAAQLGAIGGLASGSSEPTPSVSGTDAGFFGATSGDYRDHYDRTYRESGRPYEYYEPMYRYGSDSGEQDALDDSLFDEREPEVRDRFTATYPDVPYDDVREAIRHGYEGRRRS